MPVVDGITATKMIRTMDGDDAHIAKPIDVNKMVNVISGLVG